MLLAVWLQGELFPDLAAGTQNAVPRCMDDSERDQRTGLQWLKVVNSYLEFMSGNAWRRGLTERNSPERWYYLDAIRWLNGIGRDEALPFQRTISITPRTAQDIRISSLASWPVAKLVNELMRLNPCLTNRKILSHFTKVKLAQMLVEARAASRHARSTGRAA
jgi:hypothetical protein